LRAALKKLHPKWRNAFPGIAKFSFLIFCGDFV
jgi:hypothetical protein